MAKQNNEPQTLRAEIIGNKINIFLFSKADTNQPVKVFLGTEDFPYRLELGDILVDAKGFGKESVDCSQIELTHIAVITVKGTIERPLTKGKPIIAKAKRFQFERISATKAQGMIQEEVIIISEESISVYAKNGNLIGNAKF